MTNDVEHYEVDIVSHRDGGEVGWLFRVDANGKRKRVPADHFHATLYHSREGLLEAARRAAQLNRSAREGQSQPTTVRLDLS